MKSVAIFNNKGGVGKTTLTYHVACALSELGHKTLLVDLDPQSSLTLYGATEEEIDETWRVEEPYIDDFQKARSEASTSEHHYVLESPRSVHFILKPVEDGTGELENTPPPKELSDNLGIIMGRLSLHMYEDKISSRWSDAYTGDPLAIKTITNIRRICESYAEKYGYEYALVDTSPSLGVMNKVIISTLDGFVIPCAPDLFSLYGIANIGRALTRWKTELETMYQLLSDSKRNDFPNKFVKFLGYTIYNARKFAGQNELDLAQAHYNYAQQIPETIENYIGSSIIDHLSPEQLRSPIGGKSIMHSHSTLPNMAQKYRTPIWSVPSSEELDEVDFPTIRGNRARYEGTQSIYHEFAQELLARIETLGGSDGTTS